jgi:hypothetical protein
MSAGYVPSPFLVNILDLQNITSNITGLSPIQQLSNSVANIQQMVNFDQKRIFVNVISKYDQTPIQVTDDINLSNANLFINGAAFTGTGTSVGAGGEVYLSSGTTGIFVTSSPSISSPAIGFQIQGRTVFSFDSKGRALYFDPSGTGDRFWISSATLVADRLRVGGPGATSGKVLTCLDASGTAIWNYASTLQGGSTSVSVSSNKVHFITAGTAAGRIDDRQNWYLGQAALNGNNDLVASNDVTVIGGPLRYQGGGTPVVGSYVMVGDALGNLITSTMSAGPSSFVVGDQIQSGGMSVLADQIEGKVVVTGGSTEIARFLSSGKVGILKSNPSATLHVGGTFTTEGDITITTPEAIAEYVLTAQDTNGLGKWANVYRLFAAGSAQEWRLQQANNDFRVKFASGNEEIRFSSGAAYYGLSSNYNIDVNGMVAASIFSSRSPLRFFINKSTEVARIQESGFMGIGISTPLERLHVNGNISSFGNIYGSGNLTMGGGAVIGGGVSLGNTLTVAGGTTTGTLTTGGNAIIGGTASIGGNTSVGGSLNVTTNGTFGGTLNVTGSATAASFSGNGANITNIATTNVGSGSNRLDVFQTDTRAQILATNTTISTISSYVYSTLNVLDTTGGVSSFSTLSSYILQSYSTLSSLIGAGTSAEISSFSTQMGYGISTQSFFTASTVVGRQQSTNLARGFIFGSSASLRFPSSVGALAAGYKMTGDLSGAIDVSGLIYSRGLRGINAPFLWGVGQSTTTGLYAGGITGGQGWKFDVQGDIDISGNVYKNGVLYNINGLPELYWTRSPGQSNIYFNDGGVGIGVTYPSYPLDVAGKIRCWGVDVIPGPGPIVSTGQGVYVSPWLYQGSNIYYPGGGVGIGTGLSSVSTSVMLDISGSVRHHNGRFYMEQKASTLGVGYAFGAPLRGTVDVSGDIWANAGTFSGRVTALEFLSPSDRRLKEDIEPLENPYGLIDAIHGYRYKWKDSKTSDIGVIAQEVFSTLPEAVNGDLEKGLTVSYDKLIPVLIECIHELRKEVDGLKLALEKR